MTLESKLKTGRLQTCSMHFKTMELMSLMLLRVERRMIKLHKYDKLKLKQWYEDNKTRKIGNEDTSNTIQKVIEQANRIT